MTSVLVDSNVLLDLMTEDRRWFSWSAEALERAANASRLVINVVVYAEISVGYGRVEDLETNLSKDVFEREAIPYQAAFLAGKCFSAYRRRGGTRSSPLPDLFTGAHAAVAGYRLLTRDAARYRTYFPRLDLIAPDERLAGPRRTLVLAGRTSFGKHVRSAQGWFAEVGSSLTADPRLCAQAGRPVARTDEFQ